MTDTKRLSFAGIRTNSVHERTNLVTIQNMARPYEPDPQGGQWRGASSEPFARLIEAIMSARLAGKPVVWSMGAHVIKNGMSRYVIELVRHGFLTHVSGNGATSIHDFELAFLGETSEDVARSIEDGSFGMWEETGRFMNEAIQQGAALGLGYGPSLYRYLSANPERFPHYDDCVFVQCQRYGVPYTCHISIGTDIIHQHPIVDFHALGAASGEDFRTMCGSVAAMSEGGVFLNFGSAISGPEIFLRGLSARADRPARGNRRRRLLVPWLAPIYDSGAVPPAAAKKAGARRGVPSGSPGRRPGGTPARVGITAGGEDVSGSHETEQTVS
ncbi:MAG: hypothetical protein K0R28_3392 [Paenibacillus sp.]|nr:hypothetical protein [Paenibacillus sp.]